jgi:hypothetical protein
VRVRRFVCWWGLDRFFSGLVDFVDRQNDLGLEEENSFDGGWSASYGFFLPLVVRMTAVGGVGFMPV